jgi:hypothetical protein
MAPGQACAGCHRVGARAGSFSAAGTVYPTAHEPNNCNAGAAVQGAQVVLTGADGQSQTLSVNSAGNFIATAALALPFTAKVAFQGRERAMLGAQTNGDCNSCHTVAGINAAPGRILLP